MKVVGLATVVPEGSISQAEAVGVSAPMVCDTERREKLLAGLFRRSGVERRHSVILEPGTRADRQQFYPPRRGDRDQGPGTAMRMRRYEAHAAELAAAAARQALTGSGIDAPQISHLITVSCTGFFAPGVDVRLIPELGLSPQVRRTHVGFMGCHGMFNALAMANPIVASDPTARVLVVAVELCSLHFHYGWDGQKLVANALFADGAAAMVCRGDDGATPLLEIMAHGSRLLPDSEQAMSWRIGDHGFEMTLDPSVPKLIRGHVGLWLQEWLGAQGMDMADVATWAVHPGGPRVLSAFEDAVGLERGELAASRSVLAHYGNMSSVTIAFILETLLGESAPTPAVAVGFGPGMVAETFLFRW